MFIRAELKQRAKDSIHRNIWIVIGTFLVFSLLTSSNFGTAVNLETGQHYFRMGLGDYYVISLDFITVAISTSLAVIISLLTLAYSIFISNPLKVGMNRFFVENRQEPSRFEVLFSMFTSKTYLNVVKIMLLRDIYTFLWTLLFVIPGIYKAYQYYMIPYILAENPNMDSSEVFEMTKMLTEGVKLDIFVLEISFLPWYLLGIVTCGLALFYVTPYQEATLCEAYIFLRDKAIDDGYLAPIDDESEVETEYVEPTIEDLH